MNETDKIDDAALDAFFDVAKSHEPVPSGDLMARIMADVAAVQSQTATVVSAGSEAAPTPTGLFQMLSDIFGGWAGASTLAACFGLGLMFGFSSPDTILSYVPALAIEGVEDTFGLYFDAEL